MKSEAQLILLLLRLLMLHMPVLLWALLPSVAALPWLLDRLDNVAAITGVVGAGCCCCLCLCLLN